MVDWHEVAHNFEVKRKGHNVFKVVFTNNIFEKHNLHLN